MSADIFGSHNWGCYWRLVGNRPGMLLKLPQCTGRGPPQRRVQPIMALQLRLRSLCAGHCPKCSTGVTSSTHQDSAKRENSDLLHLFYKEPEAQGR